MYEKYYGFKEPPFTITPNSRFFYSSEKHAEALSTLVYAVEERKGFVVITGDIGSGKTTICRTLLNQLDNQTQTALITNTHLTSRDLLYTILEDLEISYKPGSKARLLSRLNDYLIDQLRADKNVVLIIDEAQNLTPTVLEEIRMLSNLETESEKLIQIILIGQPELRKKLALARLEQLRQRVAVFYHLESLTKDETRAYVLHRLKVAAQDPTREYFSGKALDMVYKFSRGIPRLVNQICDSAFLTGFADEKSVIDEAIMREVIEESPVAQITREDDEDEDDEEEAVDASDEQDSTGPLPIDINSKLTVDEFMQQN